MILFDIIAVAGLALSIYNALPLAAKSAVVADVKAVESIIASVKDEWSGHTREVNHKLFHRGRK